MKIAILTSLILISASLGATPIGHEFKNPSFSGAGTSAHYLTIDDPNILVFHYQYIVC